jgi:hypothetical protein
MAQLKWTERQDGCAATGLSTFHLFFEVEKVGAGCAGEFELTVASSGD